MQVLTACRRWRRSLAASLLLAEAVLCFLVPISLIVWMVVNQVQDITLRPDSIITPLKHIAALIHEKTGYNLWQEENISSMIGMIPKAGAVGRVEHFRFRGQYRRAAVRALLHADRRPPHGGVLPRDTSLRQAR